MSSILQLSLGLIGSGLEKELRGSQIASLVEVLRKDGNQCVYVCAVQYKTAKLSLCDL